VAVYSVSQVTSHIRRSLETDPWLDDLWVLGEVSNLQVAASGHSYFSLKDRQAVLRSVMFKGQPGSELLSEGASVSAHGRISFYEPRGSTDFLVDIAAPEGMGELALELERLKRKLEAEGLFEVSRKRQLPQFPKVVGVVTSPTGAVFQDILNVVSRRYPLVEIVLAPTVVQGERAAPNVVSALNSLDRDGKCDVIILARGGGSLEDLWAFNMETVARAIYGTKTPLISAIGHETDETIADYVADVRAPTPSAAAEIAVPDRAVLRQALVGVGGALHRSLLLRIDRHRAEVSRVQRQVESGLPDIQTWRRRIDDVGRVAVSAAGRLMQRSRSDVDGVHQMLRGLDPLATLDRGFSIVELSASGEVVSKTTQVAPGASLKITVTDGAISAVAADKVNGNVKGQGRRQSRPKKSQETQDQGMARLL
jgi:exodeoxyribonuclease VII large subunit